MEKMIRESPPECLSDPALGRHLFVKINVSQIPTLLQLTVQLPANGDHYPGSFTLNDQITDRDKSDALNLHSLHSPTNISQLF